VSVDSITQKDQASLQEIDETLAGMMNRLRAITNEPRLTQDTFVEVCSIYNNVSYIFLYLESNEAHVHYDWLLPWRQDFHSNPTLDKRLLELLLELSCSDPEAEDARHAYIKHLRVKLEGSEPDADEALAGLKSEAKAVLQHIQEDQLRILERLGANVESARPQATFYKLVSGTESAATRTKLVQVWMKTRDQRLDSLVELVNKMVGVRQRQSREKGYDSALAQTLERCRVGEATAREYLESYLVQALESHAGLEEEIRGAVSPIGNPMDHFGYYLRNLQDGKTVPLFSLEACLDYISFVADRVFGLTLERVPRKSTHVITVDVSLDANRCGQINFDLWDDGPKRRNANYTKGARNRMDWAGLVQQPVAYVSCRFQRRPDGANLITFQNMHSLFHEFGHAVNHLLIRKRLPNQSGLEYLPLERLENLSMWFEKWVYHPEFANSLPLSSADKEGLALAQSIKMLEYRRTHVDRAVTAALDFEVHGRAGSGLRESFELLDDRFGISRYCSLGDFPAYFTWPMFQANPGAYFSYLWGAGDSAEKFAPFMARTFEDMPPPAEVRAMFSACFDFNEPSTEPDIKAVFSFYDSYYSPRREGADAKL
jgi:oligopeptidase A